MKYLKLKEYECFESIRRVREDGTEYWEARELSKALEYIQWRNFEKVINKAKVACKNSGSDIFDHFAEVSKTIEMPKNAQKVVVDYELSRYACYLVVQNGDPRKEVIAFGQTYFAVQTRKQEIQKKEYSMLTEDQKRLYNRDLTRKGNNSLNQAAKKSE